MSSDSFRVGVVQNCATDNIKENLVSVSEHVVAAANDGAQLICLPENFSVIHVDDSGYLNDGYEEANHPALERMRELALAHNIWLSLGSITVLAGAEKVNNRSLLINASGEIVARYNKIHLFDVRLRNGEMYEESRVVSPGDALVLAPTPWANLGCSICYDVRFPQLYRALAQHGAELILVPAAFTRTTGEAHWHALVRARAIETGSFVVAADQCGKRPWGRATYGHSLVVDPWGAILADIGVESGYSVVELNMSDVARARAMIPSLTHDREFAVRD